MFILSPPARRGFLVPVFGKRKSCVTHGKRDKVGRIIIFEAKLTGLISLHNIKIHHQAAVYYMGQPPFALCTERRATRRLHKFRSLTGNEKATSRFEYIYSPQRVKFIKHCRKFRRRGVIPCSHLNILPAFPLS